MKIKRIYKGENYLSVQKLRNQIFADTGRIFGHEPSGTLEEKQAFWEDLGVTYEEVQPTEEELAAQELAQAKLARAQQVRNIKVEVDGMTFDGDETSQSRMARAIVAAEAAGKDSTTWVLADNTVATVTKAQLQMALAKAMLAMEEVWPTPYEQGETSDE